jgi:tRNA-2-methylthio-N6-dimethylallyladenosine synthase
MIRSFYIVTMGCQMNEYDSDYLAQSLLGKGIFISPSPNEADLIIINTCSVREKPEQKAVSQIGRMLSIKKRRPSIIVGAVGCVAQDKGTELMERFPGLDFVLGPRELHRIVGVIEELEKDRKRIVATDLKGRCRNPVVQPEYFSGRISGYISIMEGCNNFCSYCIVPFVRGREVSKPVPDIKREVEFLAAQNVRDITLLGQNVNSYSYYDGQGIVTLSSLLRSLDEIEDVWRLRFTTSHPRDLTDELIDCFGSVGKLCPHIHLPFQAGSNRILALMGRGYTREYYLDRVKKLRNVRRDIAITADVMVGFPGESQEDFDLTVDLVRNVEFDGLYSFMYSDRKGTAAGRLDGKINKETKAARLNLLQSMQKEITLRKNKALEGSILEVLVEGAGRRPGQLTGRSGTNKVVNFKGNSKMIGKMVMIRISQGLMNSLRGDLNG